MRKFLFILGRNWRLALAEIDSYLQVRDYSGRITDYSSNVAIVEFDNEKISTKQIGNLMVFLGSVQKIGEMIDFIDSETFTDAFPVDIENNRAKVFSGRRYVDNTLKDIVYELFPIIKNKKFFIANSIYPTAFNDPYYKESLVSYFLHYVNKFFNTYLKEQGAKQAIYYKYPQKNIESGKLNPIFPHHFLTYRLYEPNRAELLYCMTSEGMYFGKTITVADSNFQKGMDEERPFKDFKFTIPPKFAKTLISFLNLAPSVRNKKIYDPFCGSGTIIQFGHMLGYTVYGSDIDNNYIKGTRKNLEFTSQLLEDPIPQKVLNENIFQSDIADIQKHFPPNFFDGIVSEPILVPISKDLPERGKIEDFLNREVIPVYYKFFEQAYLLLKPGKRLAFVSPIIKTSENRKVNLPITSMAQKVGFKTIQLLSTDRLVEKNVENPTFELHRGKFKSIFDGGSKKILREFFLLVKPKTGTKNKTKRKRNHY